MRGFKSELLKYKRTFMWKLIVFCPVFFAAYALITQASFMKNPMSGSSSWAWENLLALVFNWWPFLFLPLGYALFAALAASQEKRSGNYRSLRSHNVQPAFIWINKVAAMSLFSLLSTLVLAAATIIAGLLSGSGAVPIKHIAAACLICWVTSLALIPIQLWAATWKGIFLSMGIGFAGMAAGVLGAPLTLWIAIPWSWATRLMCPIIGIHPNGIILEPGHPLLNTSVIPEGIAVSLAVFLEGLLITALWFNRREDK